MPGKRELLRQHGFGRVQVVLLRVPGRECTRGERGAVSGEQVGDSRVHSVPAEPKSVVGKWIGRQRRCDDDAVGRLGQPRRRVAVHRPDGKEAVLKQDQPIRRRIPLRVVPAGGHGHLVGDLQRGVAHGYAATAGHHGWTRHKALKAGQQAEDHRGEQPDERRPRCRRGIRHLSGGRGLERCGRFHGGAGRLSGWGRRRGLGRRALGGSHLRLTDALRGGLTGGHLLGVLAHSRFAGPHPGHRTHVRVRRRRCDVAGFVDLRGRRFGGSARRVGLGRPGSDASAGGASDGVVPLESAPGVGLSSPLEVVSFRLPFSLAFWAFSGPAVACFCFGFGLAGLSAPGFVVSWFVDSDDDVEPESDDGSESAPATPAPAIIAAETPTVTRPAPIHTDNRCTRHSSPMTTGFEWTLARRPTSCPKNRGIRTTSVLRQTARRSAGAAKMALDPAGSS